MGKGVLYMNILKLDHAALLVKDLERSKQFYGRILGMEEVDSEGNCWLRKGGAEIHLLEPLEERPDQINASSYSSRDLAQGNTSHVAFEVDDFNEAQRHLNTYHIEIVCGPRPRLIRRRTALYLRS